LEDTLFFLKVSLDFCELSSWIDDNLRRDLCFVILEMSLIAIKYVAFAQLPLAAKATRNMPKILAAHPDKKWQRLSMFVEKTNKATQATTKIMTDKTRRGVWDAQSK